MKCRNQNSSHNIIANEYVKLNVVVTKDKGKLNLSGSFILDFSFLKKVTLKKRKID